MASSKKQPPPQEQVSQERVEPMAERPTLDLSPAAEPPSAYHAAPHGMVRCRVHTGGYQADRLYTIGEDVLVPADELAKLAHCLSPVV